MRTKSTIQFDLGSESFTWDQLFRWNPYYLYGFLAVASVAIAFSVTMFGAVAGMVIISLLVGIPVAIYTIIDIKFGVLALITLLYALAKMSIMTGLPTGVLIDIFLLLMCIAMSIRKWRRNDFAFAKSPVSYVVWIWLIYNALQLFNPMAPLQGWIFIIRSTAGHMLFYFIVLESVDDVAFVRKLLITWIGLTFIGGLYGLFQEFHGLPESEKQWVMKDEERFRLIYNWGRFRIFSIFNDPTVFGILMSYTGLFCLTLLNAPIKSGTKIFLFFSAGIMILASMYSGTRTAYAMLPAGFVIYALITFQKKTIIITSVILSIAAGILFSPIRSIGPFITANTLERIRSAFKPNENASYLLRLENQAKIKPFIQSHPFGSGLGTIGSQGERFNPNSGLAGFDADSMYVRVAVELGWIGLAIYCIFTALVLIVGIKNYYRLKDPELKAYTAGIVAVLYSIAIANYAQMATLQLPNVLIFYALIAILIKLPELDTQSLK